MHLPEHSFDEIRRALQPAVDAIATEVDVIKRLTIVAERTAPTVTAPAELDIAPRAATSTTSSATSACTGSSSECNALPSDSGNSLALPIGLAVSIPTVGALGVFLYLHRRHVKMQRQEDAADPHKDLDFGMSNVPKGSGGGGDSITEKGGHRAQLSMEMDMQLRSPYLLPPGLQNSRESLHSLSRTIHQNEDPYRPVTQYSQGDASSIRSLPRHKGDAASVYTASSAAPSRMNDQRENLLANAARMPQSSPPTAAFKPPTRQQSLASTISPIEGGRPPFSETQSPVEMPPMPQSPPQAVVRKAVPAGAPNDGGLAPAVANTDRDSYNGKDANALRASNNYLAGFINTSEKPPSPAPTQPLPREPTPEILKIEPPSVNVSPPAAASANVRPARKDSMPTAPIIAPTATHPPAKALVTADEDFDNAFEITPPSPQQIAADKRASRYSMDVPPEEFAQAGLGAPGFNARRLSMGFRPLPPDAALEVDDPEVRANRIRSFYKEYFDESKPAPAGQYYEDYDGNYLAETGHDARNAPFAQPVGRRAMTPPPRGAMPRGPGPRPRNGSMGPMGAGPGLRGRPGPSPMGPGMGPGMGPPRFGSPGPRSYSSASGRMPPPKKKNIPPPMDLSTLPTPSKLKDDTFAILNAVDFAPPTSYRERQNGRRADSPMGERRPYSPLVPSHTPLQSAFDDLAAMPSPHLLRKSGTFTALDFAPPRRFQDPDNMSDAGSIRSNRSGISAAGLGVIRSGGNRVSRLPGDMVGTKDDLMSSLKPQWGMRAHEGQ